MIPSEGHIEIIQKNNEKMINQLIISIKDYLFQVGIFQVFQEIIQIDLIIVEILLIKIDLERKIQLDKKLIKIKKLC